MDIEETSLLSMYLNFRRYLDCICFENLVKMSGDGFIKIKHPFPDGVDMDKWVQTHTAEEFFKIIEYNKDDFLANKLNKILKGE